MAHAETFDWAVFLAVVAAALVADVLVARKGGRARSMRSAALWSGVWIGLGLLFGGWIALRLGNDAGITYLTAYVLEKSLSVDNLFLFVLIFAQTGIPAPLQHRALFWGIVGALIMRAILIGLGVYLLERFHWIIYPFAGLLVFAAVRMLWGEEKEQKLVEASCSLCSTWVARIIPITTVTTGTRFLVRDGGRLKATPLLVALLVIESTDLVFALDSIPAVFAVTRDPFLVYTSNVFALLGLRSLYFLLAGAIRELRFLRVGLAVMLLLVAAKMLFGDAIHVPPAVSLAVIAVIFGVSIAASKLFPGRPTTTAPATVPASGASPMPAPACTHRAEIKQVLPKTDVCAECVALGERWVHLRMCMTCGNVGCCDDSKNRHATAHFHATGHPIIRSIERGESWRWCYVDRMIVD